MKYPSIDEHLCFSLYAASRMMTKAYRPHLAEVGLTYPQYLVMVFLWESDGLTLNEIGGKLYLDSGTLTPLLKRLEAAKFLTRSRSKEDEREVLVYLTDLGKSLQENATKAADAVFKKSCLQKGDIAEIRKTLMDVVESLR